MPDPRLQQLAELDANAIVEIAKQMGQDYAKVKTHQLRNFFSEVVAMKALYKKPYSALDAQDSQRESRSEQLKRRLVLLQPKLAYAAGREKGLKNLYSDIDLVIKGLKDQTEDSFDKGMQNFFDLMESMIAYHKFFEHKK